MKIYTTYFANLRNLPEDIVPIAICGKAPKGWQGLSYPVLAPKKWWWLEWKENKHEDQDYYRAMYKETVLDPLIPLSVYQDLEKMGGGKDVALVCYEKPDKFCHRHLVAEWLSWSGASVVEYNYKTDES